MFMYMCTYMHVLDINFNGDKVKFQLQSMHGKLDVLKLNFVPSSLYSSECKLGCYCTEVVEFAA